MNDSIKCSIMPRINTSRANNLVGPSTISSPRPFIITVFIVVVVLSVFLIAHIARAQGFYRLQLKHGGKYLDAAYCSDKVGMSGKSDYEDGACQLWQLVPDRNGWSRLQLKHGGKYLDAAYCSDKVGMSGRSDYEDGACQLWTLIPATRSPQNPPTGRFNY